MIIVTTNMLSLSQARTFSYHSNLLFNHFLPNHLYLHTIIPSSVLLLGTHKVTTQQVHGLPFLYCFLNLLQPHLTAAIELSTSHCYWQMFYEAETWMFEWLKMQKILCNFFISRCILSQHFAYCNLFFIVWYQVVSLPARIDPHLTSAVVTLHGQLFVRVPFEQTD